MGVEEAVISLAEDSAQINVNSLQCVLYRIK